MQCIACITGLHFNSYAEQNVHLKPPTFKPTQKVFVKYNKTYEQATIITLPTRESNIYTVQIQSDGSIHQYLEKNIKEIDPLLNLDNAIHKNKYFPQWLTHEAKITLKQNNKFQYGSLLLSNNQYFFRPGRSQKNQAIFLPDFHTRAIYMLRDLQLHKGHPPYKKLEQLLQSRYIGSIVANHVSAKGLTSNHVPHLIEHKLLNENDRKIWNSAYRKEYYGLKNPPAWITITHEQYEKMKHKLKPIPTMAISTIKYDEDGQPKRAKYRIVVLGHLDQNTWSKHETYAPVMSLIELRMFITLSVYFRRVLKSGDFKQAFCQATLPPEERYILRPPHGCPETPPNSLWLLKKISLRLKKICSSLVRASNTTTSKYRS